MRYLIYYPPGRTAVIDGNGIVVPKDNEKVAEEIIKSLTSMDNLCIPCTFGWEVYQQEDTGPWMLMSPQTIRSGDRE